MEAIKGKHFIVKTTYRTQIKAILKAEYIALNVLSCFKSRKYKGTLVLVHKKVKLTKISWEDSIIKIKGKIHKMINNNKIKERRIKRKSGFIEKTSKIKEMLSKPDKVKTKSTK